jgi:DNA-binding NarL/FixJ family response regulator
MSKTNAANAMGATSAANAMGATNIERTPQNIRVLIVDDQEAVRSGFKTILNLQPDIEVIGEAANGLEAINMAKALLPDVVLMDIRMPLLDGLEATEKLREVCPQAHVLILTTFDLDEYVYRALKLGAAGFLLKDVEPKQLVEAVHVVAGDDALLSPAITRRLIARFASGELGEASGANTVRSAPAQALLDSLTAREDEIWQLVTRGLSNDEIASELYISTATAKTHVNRIMGKFDVHDRAALVVLGYENGLAAI